MASTQVVHDRAAPLARRPVFASRDLDVTQAFLESKEFRVDLAPGEDGAVDFVANVAYLPGSYLGYIQYGAAAEITVPERRSREDYWVHLPMRGRCEITNPLGTVLCGPGQAVVSSPSGHFTRSEAGSSRLTLSITRNAMLVQLAALLGEAPRRPLDFAPAIDLDGSAGLRLSSHVQLAVSELDTSGEAPHPILSGLHEQLILTGLLLSQPHSYIDILERLPGRTAPSDVIRAIDFMEAHLDAPLTLAAIAASARVPGRTLLQHFKDHRGVSPMRYLRNARLGRVREALMEPGSELTVTEIALTWGFGHMGRFATEYRRRFGETPSETRERARRRLS